MNPLSVSFRLFERPIRLFLGAGLVLAAAFLVHAWLDAREAQVRLQATLDMQRSIIEAAEKHEQQRAQELRGALAQITELKKTVTTPQQIVRELPHYLPLPQPIQLSPSAPASDSTSGERGRTVPPWQGGTPQAARQGTVAPLPESWTSSPRVAQLPVEDLKPLFDFVQDCRACKAQLASTQADLADEHAKSEALARQRDAAVKAAKGGGFRTRLARAAKWFIIGGAVGAAAAAASR